MWTCPNCGRTFQRTNQSHYCGNAPETVAQYIESQPAETHAHLTALRDAVLSGSPDCKECIAWSMPTYRKSGNSVSFSACKKHVSFYAGVEAIAHFETELCEYATKQNAIYFPYSRVLPFGLIEKLAKWCLG